MERENIFDLGDYDKVIDKNKTSDDDSACSAIRELVNMVTVLIKPSLS